MLNGVWIIYSKTKYNLAKYNLAKYKLAYSSGSEPTVELHKKLTIRFSKYFHNDNMRWQAMQKGVLRLQNVSDLFLKDFSAGSYL